MKVSIEKGSIYDSSVKDYLDLLKPRVMSLVVFTTFVGLLLAPGKIHPFIGFLSIVFTSIGAGAAGCLNMWYDRDIDAVMKRTKKRPIPSGAVNESDALALGVILSTFSVMGMFVFVNSMSAIILLISIAFYYFVYTVWLKRTTVQNIVIGGAAGAFPPMIGWATVTGNITIESISLFMIIFLWTPPHFWALALYKAEDYKNANIPMMPVVMGNTYTKYNIFYYSIAMVLSVVAPYLLGFVGSFYLVTSSIIGIYFLYLSGVLLTEKGIKTAPKLFGYSILYLFGIFLFMIIDKFFG
jgi:heme o synthase